MTAVRVKGIKRFRHRKSGVWYSYHRKTGICLEPPHLFGSPEFFTALAAAETRYKSTAPLPGTFGAMLRSYKAAPEFIQLRDRTRSDYGKMFDWLRGIDAMPIHLIDSIFITQLRNKAFKQHGRRFANYVRSVVSVIFVHGIERGLAKINPVTGTRQIRRPLHAPIANRAWTEAEKRAVLLHAPAHLIALIATARYSGLREGDIVRLAKTSYRDGTLNLTTAKRGVPHWYPCPVPLRAILNALPRHDGMRLFVNSRGTPWTQGGFSASFRKLIIALEQKHLVAKGLTMHGLRTSFAEEAADKGFNTRQIADGLAQRSTKSAEHYTRNVDRRKASKAISDSIKRTGDDVVLADRVARLQFLPRNANLAGRK